ncbi:unnamed protein product [Adineta steineri]|uniref:Uncharacterized protein n=1 Tax=Adineta steineri TaxID=433720 RepID=A0A815DPT0_9BILA|nr:unnamed protein product [Adineta steineri]CAF1191490.1 unnamed protein product [Adineta steineri]CAF1191786.1 unnamed protein product [Adineta steineri]CAF1300354.1 unnamed protein product [Adineta steineri]
MNFLVLVFFVTISTTISDRNIFGGGACGGISPVTRWMRTERNDSIRMNVDTSSCQFENPPLYFTSITGGVGHYLLTGINAIYEATNYGFIINVRSIDGANANTLMERSAQWKLQWVGLQS